MTQKDRGKGKQAIYLALLRGINLAGKNKVPMKKLRTIFEDLGHQHVRTYLQSGNVVFESGSPPPNELAGEIEDALFASLGFRIPIIVRTRRDLARIASGNPFPTEGAPPSTLHVVFLSERASSKAVKALDPDRSPPDEFRVKGSEVYLQLPSGIGRSKLTIDYFEKALGARATARNWNTVTNLIRLMNSEVG